jgi:hypothetical protein
MNMPRSTHGHQADTGNIKVEKGEGNGKQNGKSVQ